MSQKTSITLFHICDIHRLFKYVETKSIMVAIVKLGEEGKREIVLYVKSLILQDDIFLKNLLAHMVSRVNTITLYVYKVLKILSVFTIIKVNEATLQ